MAITKPNATSPTPPKVVRGRILRRQSPANPHLASGANPFSAIFAGRKNVHISQANVARMSMKKLIPTVADTYPEHFESLRNIRGQGDSYKNVTSTPHGWVLSDVGTEAPLNIVNARSRYRFPVELLPPQLDIHCD